MAGYIGIQPTPQATQTRDTFTATNNQTSFPTSGYTPEFLDVFMNGVHILNGTDYTASNGSDMVLATGATTGDIIEVVAYTTFTVASPSFTGTTTLGPTLRAPAVFTIDPSGYGDNTGLVKIAGNLQVDGTQTTINSTTLTVDDLNIVLASGAADAAASNGAGLTVAGSGANLVYQSSNDRWTLNKEVFAQHGFMIGTTSTDVGLIKNSSGRFDFEAQAGRVITFGNVTNGEHVRIAADGKVGIATDSADELLHVKQASGTTIVKTEVAANSVVGFNIKKTGATTQEWRIVDGQTVNGNLEIYDVTDSRSVMTFKGDGFVGVGTTNPGSKLEVKSSGSNTDEIALVHSGNTNKIASLGQESSHGSLHLRHNSGAQKVRLSAGGNHSYILDSNVGIGIASPGSKLAVYNSAVSGNTQLHIHNDKAGDAAVLLLEGKRTSLNDTGQVLYANNGNNVAKIDARSGGDDGALRFFVSASGTGDSMTQKMSIASDGQLLINKTASDVGASTNIVEANGNFRLSGGNYSIKFNNGAHEIVGIQQIANHKMQLGSQKVTIDVANGRLGIGTASPGSALHVNAGYIKAENTGTDAYFFEGIRNGAQTTLRIYDNANNLYIDSHTNMNFRVNQTGGGSGGSFAFSGGNVAVATTLTAGTISVPSKGITLDQSFGSGVPTILFKGTAANGRAGALNFKDSTDAVQASLYVTNGADGYGTVLAAMNGDIKFSTESLAGYKLIIHESGEIRVAGQTLVKGSNSNYHMTFPNNSGIAIGSAYTFANIYGNNGDIFLRANSYPANTGSNANIWLKTATSGGGTAVNVVVSSGQLGIGRDVPLSTVDILPNANTKKTIAVTETNGQHGYQEYVISGTIGANAVTVTMQCPSYFQAEVVATFQQSNGGADNNVYFNGIWSNNHHAHLFKNKTNGGTVPRIGSLSSSTPSFTVGVGDAAANTGKLTFVKPAASGTSGTYCIHVRAYGYGHQAMTFVVS